MNIKKILKATLFLTLVFAIQSFTTVKGVEGTWAYSAPDAPYEYAKGDIIIKKNDGKYSAEIKFQYDSVETKDIKVDKNVVVIKFDIDGNPIKVTLTVKGDSLTGVSETGDGSLQLTAKRK
jgi:hypothetical protein|tara:strand:+ start:12783 stop:13145 length:363 start_codon:yes stop_codon:yes gene_type:complete